jgi:putative restriction endonuclease
VKAVFDVKPGSGYDDDIVRRYQFPGRSNYLNAARNAIGDWVLYREPRRNGGRQAYIAAARVISVEPDLENANYYYANVASYLEFPTPVPFEVNGRYAEAPLRAIAEPNRVGMALQGKSMRAILSEDFDAIVLSGLGEILTSENALNFGLDFPTADELSRPTEFGLSESFGRRIEQLLINRKIRDASFRLEVCRAYDNRCAVTGLRLINGGGRAEVQAAHIKPVAAGGPDVVQNGIALSATAHWLFDRYLISISDDYRLLVSHNRVPAELRSLFRPEREGLHLPRDRRLWPFPAFLPHHREIYAGAIN